MQAARTTNNKGKITKVDPELFYDLSLLILPISSKSALQANFWTVNI